MDNEVEQFTVISNLNQINKSGFANCKQFLVLTSSNNGAESSTRSLLELHTDISKVPNDSAIDFIYLNGGSDTWMIYAI